MPLKLNSQALYQSSGNEKENCCFVFPSSTKRKIRHFHVLIMQRRQRNVQKTERDARTKLLFVTGLLPFCCRNRRRCFRSLIKRGVRVYLLKLIFDLNK